MAASDAPIDSLPNEILAAILAPFLTDALLPLTLVCRRFHAVTVRILHRRLLQTAALPQNELILECYHPSAKISTPYLFCRYLGTDRLDSSLSASGDPDLAGLSMLYSRFRPVVAEENRRARLRHPRQSVPAAPAPPPEEPVDEAATQDIHLDESELFSQLCTLTNVVKAGPKRGLFLSHVNLSEGVVRVWRHWLASAASGSCAAGGRGADDESILWTDPSKTVGLRFGVRIIGAERMPLLVGPEEDPPVSYKLTYQELLVRTNKLLLAVEKSAVQEVAHSGKAIVIASI